MLGKVKLKIQDKQTLNLKEENTTTTKIPALNRYEKDFQLLERVYHKPLAVLA